MTEQQKPRLHILVGFKDTLCLEGGKLDKNLAANLRALHDNHGAQAHAFFTYNSVAYRSPRDCAELVDQFFKPAGMSGIAIFSDGIFQMDPVEGRKELAKPAFVTRPRGTAATYREMKPTYVDLLEYFGVSGKEMAVIDNVSRYRTRHATQLDISVVDAQSASLKFLENKLVGTEIRVKKTDVPVKVTRSAFGTAFRQ